MKLINVKVRLKNRVFIVQLLLAVLTPMLAYAGLTMQDMTTWKALGDLIVNAISNPFVLMLVIQSVWNAINDPTTKGIKDAPHVMKYTEPKGE